MKILFLASTFRKPNPSFHLMQALIEDLLDAGIQVHAIQRKWDSYGLPAAPVQIACRDGFSCTEIPSKEQPRRAFVRRYLEAMGFALRQYGVIRKHDDYDVIFIQSSIGSFFHLCLARRLAKGRPVIFNNQDMFPGSAIANGSMPKKWMQRVFYAMQRFAYKRADIIIAISEDMKQKLMQQGVSEEKIRVIVNWYDDRTVRKVEWEDNQFVQKYDLQQDAFYVQYAGTMGTNFDPEPVLQIAQRLREKEDIHFQMIGDGIRRGNFEREAHARGLSNIVFYPLQSQDMVSDVYSACSVCLIPLQRGVIGNSVPSKAALVMACSRVIVSAVDEDSDYARMFAREQMGFCADPDDYDALAQYILALRNDPDLYASCAHHAEKFACKEYSRAVNTSKYIELFRQYDP